MRRRFQRAVARKGVILVSSIVAFELWYGVAKSHRKDSHTQRLDAFFAGPLEWTLFDEDDRAHGGNGPRRGLSANRSGPMICFSPARRDDGARHS